MEDFEGIDDLPENLHSLSLLHLALLFDESIKGAPVAEFIDEIVVVLGAKHLDVLDDVVVGRDGGESLYLVDCTLLQLGIILECLDRDHLDCITGAMLRGVIHLPIHPFPYLLVQRIIFYNPIHNQYIIYSALGLLKISKIRLTLSPIFFTRGVSGQPPRSEGWEGRLLEESGGIWSNLWVTST